jgi:hypothetical protein
MLLGQTDALVQHSSADRTTAMVQLLLEVLPAAVVDDGSSPDVRTLEVPFGLPFAGTRLAVRSPVHRLSLLLRAYRVLSARSCNVPSRKPLRSPALCYPTESRRAPFVFVVQFRSACRTSLFRQKRRSTSARTKRSVLLHRFFVVFLWLLGAFALPLGRLCCLR